MLNLEHILAQDRLMRAMTGMNLKSFEEMLPSFTEAYEEKIVEHIPGEIPIEGDLGFQGLQNEFENIHLPHKKPRGKGLTEKQKEENKALSSKRVKCEHAHAGIKRYNCVVSIYRNRKTGFDDQLMLIATGLWNFYLKTA